jgi:hypothetical protein
VASTCDVTDVAVACPCVTVTNAKPAVPRPWSALWPAVVLTARTFVPNRYAWTMNRWAVEGSVNDSYRFVVVAFAGMVDGCFAALLWVSRHRVLADVCHSSSFVDDAC